DAFCDVHLAARTRQRIGVEQAKIAALVHHQNAATGLIPGCRRRQGRLRRWRTCMLFHGTIIDAEAWLAYGVFYEYAGRGVAYGIRLNSLIRVGEHPIVEATWPDNSSGMKNRE